MPPQIHLESEDEEPESQSRVNGAADVIAEDDEMASGEEDGQDGADAGGGEDQEYEIEEIVEHRAIKKGKEWEYRIRWGGYGEEDDTWEPHSQIFETAEDAIDTYWKKHGGYREPGNKRKRTSSPPHSSQPAAKARARQPLSPAAKVSSTVRNTQSPAAASSTAREESWKAPLELVSWEDEAAIDTIEKDREGTLFFIVSWKEGKVTRHRAELVYQKMPLRVLKFYEANLVFRTPDQIDH